jgi:hypothetical protein
MRIEPIRAGMAFALFLGLFHACWALLVALGMAQPLMDFIFRVHFIVPIYRIEPFEMGRAALLVGFVSILGMLLGWLAVLVWNGVPGGQSK